MELHWIDTSSLTMWQKILVLNERLIQVTEEKVINEQGDFRKGKECVDQIFVMKRIVEEYFGKGEKLNMAFMDFKKSI